MTEQLDFSWVYDLTPLATFRMVTRLEHLTEAARHLNHQQFAVLELRERQGRFRYVAERQLDVAAGSRFFSSRPMLKQIDVWNPPNWDGSRQYQTTGELRGMAVAIAGAGGLTPLGSGGTRYSLSLTISSTRHKLETQVAASLSKTIEAEHAFRLTWLGRKAHGGL